MTTLIRTSELRTGKRLENLNLSSIGSREIHYWNFTFCMGNRLRVYVVSPKFTIALCTWHHGGTIVPHDNCWLLFRCSPACSLCELWCYLSTVTHDTVYHCLSLCKRTNVWNTEAIRTNHYTHRSFYFYFFLFFFFAFVLVRINCVTHIEHPVWFHLTKSNQINTHALSQWFRFSFKVERETNAS